MEKRYSEIDMKVIVDDEHLQEVLPILLQVINKSEGVRMITSPVKRKQK